MARLLRILKDDSWLRPFAAAIEGRHQDVIRKEKELISAAGTLSDFANAHK